MVNFYTNISGNNDQKTELTSVLRVFNFCRRSAMLRTLRIFKILRVLRILFVRNYLKEIVKKTDLYLHYSNYILFEKSSFLPALKFIFLKIRSAGGSIFAGDAEVLNGPKIRFTSIQNSSENINSFDGVIERYCGVPP